MTETDVTGLVTAMLGSPPGDALRELTAHAVGNPLYVRELVDAMVREQAVEIGIAAAEVSAARERLPASLAAVLNDRLSSVSDQTAQMLRTAALLGGRFTVTDRAELLASRLHEHESGLQSLWHYPYQIIRYGCPIHAAPATWLGHPRRINRPRQRPPGRGATVTRDHWSQECRANARAPEFTAWPPAAAHDQRRPGPAPRHMINLSQGSARSPRRTPPESCAPRTTADRGFVTSDHWKSVPRQPTIGW
jgi:hypothetical protein